MPTLVSTNLASLASYAVIGLLAAVGFLYKKGFITLTPAKTPEVVVIPPGDHPVSKSEFDEAMKRLTDRLEEVAQEAGEAKASANAASITLQQTANSIEQSIRHMTQRFDESVTRLEGTMARLTKRQDHQETKVAGAEASLEKQGQVLELLLRKLLNEA